MTIEDLDAICLRMHNANESFRAGLDLALEHGAIIKAERDRMLCNFIGSEQFILTRLVEDSRRERQKIREAKSA